MGNSGQCKSLRICPVGMSVIALEENRAIREDFIQIPLVRERLRGEHGVIPATAKNPIVPGMPGGILAQAFLNVGGVSCTFEIYPPETERAVEKMDVTVNETREHQFSARVDHFCARAARVLDFLIVTDGHDLAVSNGHGLSPRLLGVFRVNPAVHDHDLPPSAALFFLLP